VLQLRGCDPPVEEDEEDVVEEEDPVPTELLELEETVVELELEEAVVTELLLLLLLPVVALAIQ
jgi:hypothetical protein